MQPVMIPVPAAARQPARWQALWRDALRDPVDLLEGLGLPGLAARVSTTAQAQFPLRVPRGYAARMRHGDPADPLLRQVLPLDDEDRVVPGFSLDAVGDGAAKGGTGVIHKYDGRALLIATGSCAIHCRYCFRRHFPYAEETAAAAGWAPALAYLRGDPSVHEVILSGGDPLSLATAKLSELTEALRTLPQVTRLRIHTRLPIVLPERIDEDFLQWIAALPWPTVMVVHANHANEIDDGVREACAALRARGVHLLNQAGRSLRSPVRRRRTALLPASARPRAGHGALRGPGGRSAGLARGHPCPPARLPGAAPRPRDPGRTRQDPGLTRPEGLPSAALSVYCDAIPLRPPEPECPRTTPSCASSWSTTGWRMPSS
jgi:EF-P beta-lysylation protein EpmB